MFLRWLERIIDRRIEAAFRRSDASTVRGISGIAGSGIRTYRPSEALRKQQEADTERLKALGGIDRTPEEQREWIDLVGRNMHRNIRYFEERRWEREPVAAPTPDHSPA